MKNRILSIRASILLFLFLFILFCSPAHSTSVEVFGDITQNTTWSEDTMLVTGDITVLDNSTLTINPGLYIEFQGNYNIHVKGTLLAEGVPGDTIMFTIHDTTGWSTFDDPGGGWGGILFADSTGSMADNDTSRLSICKFSYTKVHENYGRGTGATIFCYQFNKLRISGCFFTTGYARSYGGSIYLSNSNIILVDNSISGYRAFRGAAIYIYGSARIENNTIKNNSTTNGGGAIWLQSADTILLRNNEISHNHSDYNGGAIYGRASVISIENNLFHDNTSDELGGAIFLQGSFNDLIIRSNQFYSNHSEENGGAIYLYPYSLDSGAIENNHLYDNTSGDRGGALWINMENDDLLVQHNDIHDNTARIGGALFSQGKLSLFDNEIYNNEINYDYGGAIVLFYGSQHVMGNDIYSNTARMRGGAIHIESGSPLIEDNLIYDNHTNQKNGGAISVNKASPTMIGNLITGNNAFLGGGGIHMQESHGYLINNIIVNNEAQEGGAVYLDKNSSPTFINNTISKNSADFSEAGGAVYLGLMCIPAFYNNIINENIAAGLANQICFSTYNPFCDFYNCDIEDGVNGFTQVPGSTFMGKFQNNFDLDPLFKQPSSVAGNSGDGLNADWRVIMNSPCLNKGTQAIDLVELPEKDYFGNRRISYSYIDVGAFEFADTVYEYCGTISTDAVWAADTIKVCDDVIINDSITLTVLPGVYVEFQDQFKLQVNGTLISIGTINDQIIFTAKDTLGFLDPSVKYAGWDGIEFRLNTSNDSSKLSHTIIEYCKIGDLFQGGAISVFNSPKLSVSNCTIRHNIALSGGAIYAYGSPILIEKSHFLDNSVNHPFDDGGAIYLQYSDVYIDRCVFEDNLGGFGGAIYLDECNPTISGCTIRNNFAMNAGGGIYVGNRSNPVITNNIIQYNGALNGGAIMLEGEHPIVSYNVISNNSGKNGGALVITGDNNLLSLSNNIIANNSATQYGGGISYSGKHLELINNTIVNNIADDGGGGLYINQYLDGQIKMYNSIFGGNKGQGTDNQMHLQGFMDLEIHYSNIQGGIGLITGTAPNNYENNIDAEPSFINPTSGAGNDYLTQAEDWIIASNSASINVGIPDVSGLPVGETDILLNERIHFDRIDQGAVENQGDIPVIMMQPVTQFRCEGGDVSFTVTVNDSVDYQWTENGVDIAGANEAELAIDSLTVNHQGTYQCIIRNSYGTVYSNPVFLQVIEKPEIFREPVTTWAQIQASVAIETYAQGTDLKYQWQKDDVDIANQKTPKLTFDSPDLDDEGQYKCIISNSCLSIESEKVDLYLAPQICMVTVSQATGDNLIVWEKASTAPIEYFNIYRESKYANIYDKLATIPYDDLSVFVDTTADPGIQAYLYKITGTDTSGYETEIELCTTHKTIHLLATTNPETNATQLDWDQYVGFEYGTYEIYRSDTTFNFSSIHEMSSSTSTWADTDPGTDTKYYRIAAVKPESCLASGNTKAGAGPYRHALSNLDDNKLRGTAVTDMISSGELAIYPNPVTDRATIRFPNPDHQAYRFILTNMTGKVMHQIDNITENSVELSRNNLSKGLYLVELRGPAVYRGKILIE